MKIEISEKKEIEITLPYYTKSPAFFYKVVSKESCIQVLSTKFDKCGSINFAPASLAFCSSDTEECSADEFNEKFELVINQLNELKNL